MTKNPTDSKQTNTNTTAQSISDPSDGFPTQSSSQNSSQTSPNKSNNDHSTPPPLQPDPQHSDSTNSNSGLPTTIPDPQHTPNTPSTPADQTSSPSRQQPQSISVSQQQQPPNLGSAMGSPYTSLSDWGFDDTFDDLDGDTASEFNSPEFGSFGSGRALGNNTYTAQAEKRMTPEERVKMIERIYNEIFQRSPDTRDINYYKYSTLSEDQIRRQLTASAEHTDIIKKGREYNGIKEHAEQLESRVRMLEGQIKDHVEEFRELSNLLQEKNHLIQQLRANNSHSLPRPKEGPIQPEQAAQPIPSDNRGLQPESKAEIKTETATPKNDHTVNSNPSLNEGTTQPELREPSSPNLQTISTPQATTPHSTPVFTSQCEAPPPPDIQTESGIITAEPNSLARRLKRAIKDILRSFF